MDPNRAVTPASLERGSDLEVSSTERNPTGKPPAAAFAATTVDLECSMERPKRPLSAYNMFFRDQREILLKTLPAAQRKNNSRGHGKIGFQDLAKVIGAKWREVDPEVKGSYEKIAAEGRKTYLENMKEWKDQRKKNGLPTTRPKKKGSNKGPSPSRTHQGASLIRNSHDEDDLTPLPLEVTEVTAPGTLHHELRNRQFACPPGQIGFMGPRIVSNISVGNESSDFCNSIAHYPGHPFQALNTGDQAHFSFHQVQPQFTGQMDVYMPSPPNAVDFYPSQYANRPAQPSMETSSYSEAVPSQASGYPLQGPTEAFSAGDIIEPFPFYSEETEPLPPLQNGGGMAHLANRMGRRNVDLFVDMFGP